MANISLDDLADELHAEIRDAYDGDGVRAVMNVVFRLSARFPDNAEWFLRRALTGQG